MFNLAMLLLSTGCATHDGDGAKDTGSLDGGSSGDSGDTADGGTPGEVLCREVITDYVAGENPLESSWLNVFVQDMRILGKARWEIALDGSDLSTAPLSGAGLVGDLLVVDWVADGSPDAIYPCMNGPATRKGLGIPLRVDDDEAMATLWGYVDGNAEQEFWLTRVGTNDVTWSPAWQALVDKALLGAGHEEARDFASLTYAPGEHVVLTLGSEAGDWSQAWWQGPMEDGDDDPF